MNTRQVDEAATIPQLPLIKNDYGRASILDQTSDGLLDMSLNPLNINNRELDDSISSPTH